jgi:hypothetical protein
LLVSTLGGVQSPYTIAEKTTPLRVMAITLVNPPFSFVEMRIGAVTLFIACKLGESVHVLTRSGNSSSDFGWGF